MDEKNELFSSGEQETKTSTPPEVEEKNYLEELVGEGKKFSDAQALAKGKAKSDAFIDQLEDENATLRQELQHRTRLEEFLDRLESKQEGQPEETIPQEPVEDRQDIPSSNTPGTSQDIQKLITEGTSKAVTEALAMKEYQDNVDKVHGIAEETLGSNYKNVLTQRADSLGVSTEMLSELAAKNPEGFVNLLVKPKSTDIFQGIPQSEVNTSAINTTSSVGARTKSYYDKIRKEDINVYLSPKIQNEMIKQAEKLGDDFYK